MPSTADSEKHKRLWHANSGPRGVAPILPPNPNDWRPGMPTHWVEQTSFLRRKTFFVRLFSFIQLIVAVVYLQYRARKTIGVFEASTGTPMLIYQIFFYVLECISAFAIIFRLFESWKVVYRNCINLHRIPNDLLVPHFSHSSYNRNAVPPQFCNYPSVGVFIPCYNEDVDLITETVVAALQIDYPSQLLTVYLCDDGRDTAKRQIISQLRHQHTNVHYVIRPRHDHAKAGNLNYAIQRTRSDLIVTLDADFVARPNLLQRLIPYYYVWNPIMGMYEFNETLAYVQTPQYFRNLSPYDSDPLDQRGIFFFDNVLPGKDWFNASTLVGTTNLISRTALKRAKYYPYHSITEDSALSIIFHGLGYRSYYVRESLATGLATTSLWTNLRQRARWLKGDWQILFSRHGPLSQKGLNLIQRILYLNMGFSRLISVVHLIYDIVVILLLTVQLSPLDARDPVEFVIYLGGYLLAGFVYRYVASFGGGGLDKSESGNVAFEAIFRYTSVKGLFIALFRGDKLKFKVTDKPVGKRSAAATAAGVGVDIHANRGSSNNRPISVSMDVGERFVENSRGTVLGQPGPGMESYGVENVNFATGQVLGAQDVAVGTGRMTEAYSTSSLLNTESNNNDNDDNDDNDGTDNATSDDIQSSVRFTVDIGNETFSSGDIAQANEVVTMPTPAVTFNGRRETLRSGSSSEYSELTTEDDHGRSFKKRLWSESIEERAKRRIDIRKNLKRTWFNCLMAIILIYAIVWGILFPPSEKSEIVTDATTGESTRIIYNNLLPTGLALGFALCNLLPHLLALYLCFIPYLSGWVMTDLQNGRCDQWAIHPKSGKLFVPFSFISLMSLARIVLIIGAVALTVLASLAGKEQRIPMPS